MSDVKQKFYCVFWTLISGALLIIFIFSIHYHNNYNDVHVSIQCIRLLSKLFAVADREISKIALSNLKDESALK